MPAIISKPNTLEKLKILSTDAQYDLACACGSGNTEHRKRHRDKWIYPVTLPNGGKSTIFKTLFSNTCSSDCRYCPLRAEQNNIRRCSLTSEETARAFLDYYQKGEVFGLFLSSGIISTADSTMQKLTDTAEILRKKYRFKGYIHLKILPGSSPAAVEKAVSLSSAVSLNIETPGSEYLKKLSTRKDFLKDIIAPIKLISELTSKGRKYSRVKQTTQFIVGPGGETDIEIIKYTAGLYNRLNMQRVFFSAYQDLRPAEPNLFNFNQPRPAQKPDSSTDNLTREHRLYQADYLLRKYGFEEKDFSFRQGNLDLEKDPKQIWADNHPDFFPVNVNKADKYQLLRVPGLGPITVKQILKLRRKNKLTRLSDITRSHWLKRSEPYVKF